jgi:hypothetical protein
MNAKNRLATLRLVSVGVALLTAVLNLRGQAANPPVPNFPKKPAEARRLAERAAERYGERVIVTLARAAEHRLARGQSAWLRSQISLRPVRVRRSSTSMMVS